MNKQLKFSIALLLAIGTGLLVLNGFNLLGQTIFASLTANRSITALKATVDLCMEQYLFQLLAFVAAAMASSFLGNLIFKEPNKVLFSLIGFMALIFFVFNLLQLAPPTWVVVTGLLAIPVFSFFGYRFALRLHD